MLLNKIRTLMKPLRARFNRNRLNSARRMHTKASERLSRYKIFKLKIRIYLKTGKKVPRPVKPWHLSI